jgi:hypothetical protein
MMGDDGLPRRKHLGVAIGSHFMRIMASQTTSLIVDIWNIHDGMNLGT